MRKIYFWIVAALFVVGVLPASAVKFTINIPYAEGVTCQVNYEPYEVHDGANEFDVAQYTAVVIKSVNPYRISGITDQNGTAPSGFYGTEWYFYPGDDVDGNVYTIAMVNMDEFRTDSFTLNVDDPSLVQAFLGGYNTVLDLKAGENIVKYDPAVETILTLNPTNYQLPIYSVKFNDAEVESEPNSTSYYITLESGCYIDVEAILPDKDRTITFTYNEGATNCISSISINYVPVADFNGETLVAKIGSNIMIQFDTENYKYNSYTINGVVDENPYPTKFFTLMKDTEFYIDAAPVGTIPIKVIVSNPNLINIYRGYSSPDNTPLELVEGENIVEANENNAIISWTVKENAFIESVTLNGEVLGQYQSMATGLKENDVLEFDVRPIVYDKEAVVWFDTNGVEEHLSDWMFAITSEFNRYQLDLKASEPGYKVIEFLSKMNPFRLQWAGDNSSNPAIPASVYVDGEKVETLYPGSNVYNFNLSDKSVVKAFLNSVPEECHVSFDIAEDVEPTVIRDIIVEVADASAGFDCFAGTVVTISGEGILVSVNGESLQNARANDYTFTVTEANTEVKVEKDPMSAVNQIGVESADDDVFNTLGLRVSKRSDMNNLTPGIYVVGGKKIVVK